MREEKLEEYLVFGDEKRVRQETNSHNGNNSNALRKYYESSNGRRPPTLAEYKYKVV